MRKAFNSLSIVAVAIALGCTTEPKVADFADLAGEVVSIRPQAANTSARALIRGAYLTNPQDIVSEFDVHVGGRIYVEDARKRLLPASQSEIREGDRVRVWTTGVELRSLPPQVFSQIIIVERY